METGTTPVEGNAATKSTGSNIVQINSIYIDLQFPPEKNEIVCSDHDFSIRGYAAELKKKNPGASTPFPSNASLNNIEEQLPPMKVPKFRWWCCLECRRKIEDASNVEGTPVHYNCCTHSTPSNAPSHADSTVMLSETQPLPLAQLSEGTRNVDINAPPSHQEQNDIDTEDVSASVGLVIDEAGPTRDEEISAETGNVINAGDAIHNAADVAAAEMVNSSGVAPMLLEESGNASTGSEQNKRHENSSGMSRRRRKVRSLTELLGDKGKLRSGVLKADVPSIHLVTVPASGSVTVLSQDQTPREDIGSGNKSPPRKRKTPQEEPEGNIYPRIAGPDGSISKAGRTVTDNATCSSEAQANASSAVRLPIDNTNDHSSCKAEKAPVLVKQKDKQIQVHDRFSPRPEEQSSNKNRRKGGNLHIAIDNTLFRSLGTSAAAVKVDNHSTNSQSPQVPHREKCQSAQIASPIPKSQPSHLVMRLDLSLNSFVGNVVSSRNKEMSSSRTSVRENNDLHFGQCSILPPPEPDLLRKKSQVWDLNERLARNSNNLVKKLNPFLTKETRCQKEKTSEVQGRPKEINRQSDNLDSNRMAQGSPDDIPMDIVELMAKNQYERGLPDAGTNSFQDRISNGMGRFSKVQGMVPIMFTKAFPASTSFSTANARSGLAMAGNAINYPQMQRNNFDICNPEKSKKGIFDMFPPQNQQMLSRGMQCTASASVRTGSQRGERAEIVSSSAAPNMPFGIGIQPKYPESQHRGKTISDIKAGEMKKRQDAHIIFSKPGNAELRSKPKGPVDPHVNDNIPAMQLLSLTKERTPGTTFNLGSRKPFSPCGYHPRYSTTERRDMLSGPLFQRQSWPGTGTSSVGENLGRSPGQRSFAFPGPQKENQSYLARYTSGIPYTGPTSSRGKHKETANVGASDSILYLQQHLGRKSVSLGDGIITEEVQQLRLIPRQEQTCITNQNPAEFILLDSEAFTICWKDLKFPKRKFSRGNAGDGVKRQRVAKPKAGKEQPLIPSS